MNPDVLIPASDDNEKISSNVFEISREKLLVDVQRLRDNIFERDPLFGYLYSQRSFGTYVTFYRIPIIYLEVLKENPHLIARCLIRTSPLVSTSLVL